jgi:hypothetical protein
MPMLYLKDQRRSMSRLTALILSSTSLQTSECLDVQMSVIFNYER